MGGWSLAGWVGLQIWMDGWMAGRRAAEVPATPLPRGMQSARVACLPPELPCLRLPCERIIALWPPPPAPSCSTWSLASMALALLQEQQKAGLPVGNAGHLLLGFLKYYGRVFDLEVGAAPGTAGVRKKLVYCPVAIGPACWGARENRGQQ